MRIDTSSVWFIIAIFVIQIIANVIISHMIKKKLEERDRKQAEKEQARVEYENVVLDVTNANAKLSYALAMAIKRGSPNGEVEAGISAYNEAMQKQTQFLQKQAIYRIAS